MIPNTTVKATVIPMATQVRAGPAPTPRSVTDSVRGGVGEDLEARDLVAGGVRRPILGRPHAGRRAHRRRRPVAAGRRAPRRGPPGRRPAPTGEYMATTTRR